MENKKIYREVYIQDYDHSLFVLSDDGQFLFQFKDEHIGFWNVTDPVFYSQIKVYRNGHLQDTIRLSEDFFLLPNKEKGKRYDKLISRKKIRLSSSFLSVKNDMLRVKTKNGGKEYFIDMKTGRLVKESMKDEGFEDLVFRLEYMDYYERERLKEHCRELR